MSILEKKAMMNVYEPLGWQKERFDQQVDLERCRFVVFERGRSGVIPRQCDRKPAEEIGEWHFCKQHAAMLRSRKNND